jgi:hypothetical protein
MPVSGKSKTPSYRIFYKALGALWPLLRRALPNQVLTTREIGQTMLAVATRGFKKYVLDTRDIRAVLNR